MQLSFDGQRLNTPFPFGVLQNPGIDLDTEFGTMNQNRQMQNH